MEQEIGMEPRCHLAGYVKDAWDRALNGDDVSALEVMDHYGGSQDYAAYTADHYVASIINAMRGTRGLEGLRW